MHVGGLSFALWKERKSDYSCETGNMATVGAYSKWSDLPCLGVAHSSFMLICMFMLLTIRHLTYCLYAWGVIKLSLDR